MRLVLVGFGTVGQGLADLLHNKQTELATQYDFQPLIVGAATRTRGTLYRPDGLNIAYLMAAIHSGHLNNYPESAGLQRNLDTLSLIKAAEADAVVEASYTNLQTAQPALDYCRMALTTGKHLVLANKGPVALAGDELRQAAKKRGLQIRYEATVMAGTPTLSLADTGLAGCAITRARGILNGTTNYILTQMENGMEYATALQQAQALGYAEADPSGDVDGWDAAGKVLILAAALFGKTLTMDALDVTGISGIGAADVADAQANNERWKLIATITPTGGSVQPIRLPISDPLANVSGATNAITYETDTLGHVTLIGPGAGREETGYGLLADLLAIHRLQTQNV